jgi:predicted Holliday junction resolvase-like endonuclease
MKPPQFIVAVILSLVPLVLVINLIFMGQKNQSLQATLQAQQEDINKGSMSQQVGVNLLKEIAQASVKDDKLKDVLTKSGYTVTVNATASPSPSRAAATTPSATP